MLRFGQKVYYNYFDFAVSAKRWTKGRELEIHSREYYFDSREYCMSLIGNFISLLGNYVDSYGEGILLFSKGG